MIAEAKAQLQETIGTSDQEQLVKALVCLDSEMKAGKLPSPEAVRVVFVTNKINSRLVDRTPIP